MLAYTMPDPEIHAPELHASRKGPLPTRTVETTTGNKRQLLELSLDTEKLSLLTGELTGRRAFRQA